MGADNVLISNGVEKAMLKRLAPARPEKVYGVLHQMAS